MIYNIYEWLGKTSPHDFGGIYIMPKSENFLKFACNLVVENGSFRIDGRDERLKAQISEALEREPKNALPIPTGGWNKDNNVHISGREYINIGDKRFAEALNWFLTGYFCKPEGMRLIKVNSLADVERVKREYAEKNGLQEAA